jgi:hypothetical protein
MPIKMVGTLALCLPYALFSQGETFRQTSRGSRGEIATEAQRAKAEAIHASSSSFRDGA